MVLELENCKVVLTRQGVRTYTKASYPIRYGRYSEIEYGRFRYQFNTNGEVKYISGSGPDWPHPAEWLKRTIGNDWVYYSTGSYYTGVVDLYGEYYLPCPAYPSNSLFKEYPFACQSVASALLEYEEMVSYVQKISQQLKSVAYQEVHNFLTLVGRCSTGYLRSRASRLHRILKASVSVLPPDCRHVDYDIIPLMITDGCLYNCSFCKVKTGMDLTSRSRQEITDQILALKELFGPDLQNYNSIYLGQHDALAAKPDDILFAAEQTFKILEIDKSFMQGPRLFLFGSAESFLQKKESFWASMNRLPFYTYVNLGLESFDSATLKFLKKPVSSVVMLEAFKKMLAINKDYENIEATANFLIGEELPASHMPPLVTHIDDAVKGVAGKGCIYISPLKGSKNTKELLAKFRTVKLKNRIQTYLYLIQRL